MNRVLGSNVRKFAGMGVAALLCGCAHPANATSPSGSDVTSLRKTAIVSKPQSRPTPPSVSSASWSRLRKGLPVFTGTDGGGSTTVTICPTLAAYEAFEDSEGGSSCFTKPRGVAATVEKVIPAKPDDPTGAPHVELRAANGAWSGFSGVVLLQPAVPAGTTFKLARSGSETINLAPREDSDVNAGLNLGDSVTLRVLKFHPAAEDRSLYVEVMDGQFTGRKGWVFALDADTEDGASLEGVDYDAATPKPTTDPMQRSYTLTTDLRVFDDVQTCQDGFDAMHDDEAYKRLKDAVSAGQYHDFEKGDTLHIVSDPDPNELWVIVADDSGNRGCASRYNLPGY